MPVSSEAAAWGMKLLLGYEDADESLVEFHRAGYDTVDQLRTSFMQTGLARKLFAAANPELADPHKKLRYEIPGFLLRRPELAGVMSRFEEPSLATPACQLCTSEQMGSPEYHDLCKTLGLDSTVAMRKVWEFAYVLAVLRFKRVLQPGRRGLGFGTGSEMLPSVFANLGVGVTATDAPADLSSTEVWAKSAQWTKGLEDLWRKELVPREDFFERVTYQPVDMNNIPEELRDYDFCWSACALEHLGSLRKGLDFIKNSLNTLRPGGIAVHTTEFNMISNDKTFEEPTLCLFRKQDIEKIIHELTAEGHHVEPLNLWPGSGPVDEHIDLPPFGFPHLKLMLGDYVTTSIGLTVTKAAP